MTSKNQTQQEIASQLDGLTETMQREQVKLTPEISAYLKEKVEAVQNKLMQGETVFEKDLEFINKVKLWLMLPEDLRKKFQTMEEMESDEEIKEYTKDDVKQAQKYSINLRQWAGVKNLAEFYYGDLKEGLKNIDKFLEFTNGKIIGKLGHLDLEVGHTYAQPPLKLLPDNFEIGSINILSYQHLKKFPPNLQVKWLTIASWPQLNLLPEDLKVFNKLIVRACENFKELPENLNLEEKLELVNCDGVTEFPENLSSKILDIAKCKNLTKLSKNLTVEKLYVSLCPELTELPDRMYGLNYLCILDCPKIKCLPNDLRLDRIRLNSNVSEQVKKDAERLKAEGKIQNIDYE